MKGWVAGLAWGAMVIPCADAAPEDAPPARGILLFLADDWSAPHAGTYGEPRVRTPAVDRLARGGIVFENAFVSAPLCAPSRAILLTGRPLPALGTAAHQGGDFPDTVVTYPELLMASGWAVGHAVKGWGPGPVADPALNPAGPRFESFTRFLEELPLDQPFHFWHGSRAPHRPYVHGSGLRAGKSLADAPSTSWLPDRDEVRGDVLDYVASVEAMDHELGTLLRDLDRNGRADSTLVVVTSDNGMPFPRAKSNVYDAGTRVPLVANMGQRGGGRVADDLIDLVDLSHTFLEIAGSEAPPRMTGRSFAPRLRGEDCSIVRDAVILARERHERARADGKGYPVRALRTQEHLYVRNLRPDREPAGENPGPDGAPPFADVDPSRTKAWMVRNLTIDDPFFAAAFGKRPAEELYDLATDPDQRHDVARDPALAAVRDSLRERLAMWAADVKDPRAAEIRTPEDALEFAPDAFEAIPLPERRARREVEP